MVFGPSTKNYVTIAVGGPQVANDLAALRQTIGANGKVVRVEKLHFSVCKTDVEWSAMEVAQLAKDVAAILAHPPQAIHDSFICDKVAFFSTQVAEFKVYIMLTCVSLSHFN